MDQWDIDAAHVILQRFIVSVDKMDFKFKFYFTAHTEERQRFINDIFCTMDKKFPEGKSRYMCGAVYCCCECEVKRV